MSADLSKAIENIAEVFQKAARALCNVLDNFRAWLSKLLKNRTSSPKEGLVLLRGGRYLIPAQKNLYRIDQASIDNLQRYKDTHLVK